MGFDGPVAMIAAVRIAVTGDSIAYGRNDPAGGWAARLAEHHLGAGLPGRRVWNLAIPGATLLGMRRYSPAECRVREVDTVLIGAGINDIAGIGGTRETPKHLTTGMEELCLVHEGDGRRVVVLGPTWFDEQRIGTEMGLRVETATLQCYRESLAGLCERTGRVFVDMWEPLAGRTDLLADGVHPSHEGHQVLWEHLMRVWVE